MFSKSRAVFNSTGIVILLVLVFFWISPLIGFATLENFLHEATQANFFGYGFAEVLGASINDSPEVHALRLKIILSFVLFILGLLLFLIGSFGKLRSQIRILCSVIGWATFFTIIFIIFNIIHEDHVMNKSHRLELFIFGTIAVFVGVALAYFFKGEEGVNSSNSNMLGLEKTSSENDLKENTNEAHFSHEKDSSDTVDSEEGTKMSEAQDIPSGEKVVEGKDKEPDVKPDKDAIEKEAVKEDSVDEVIPLPSPDNLNQELAEAETGKEEFVKDSSEDGENVDPFSEANINDEEDPLANETPSRKVLPPPSADELSDEVLKLREELSASQNESETEGKEDKGLDSEEVTEKNVLEKEVVNVDSADEVITPPTDDNLSQELVNLRKELAEADKGEEELVKDSSEDGENTDPFSETNIKEEDPLANDTPSRKVLPPPSTDELSDELQKLREELSASQNESETEGKEEEK